MAAFLYLISKVFIIRPIPWFYEKVFRKNQIKRSIALEVHFFLISLFYFLLFIVGLSGNKASNSIALIISILGTLSVSFELSFDSATSVEDVTRTEHNGYTATFHDDDTVSITENTKEKLTGATIVALLFSPFNVLIRFINLVISFKTIYSDSRYICLLGHYGHATDNVLKKIFCDTVTISDYCGFNNYRYDYYINYQREHGIHRSGVEDLPPETEETDGSEYEIVTLTINEMKIDFYIIDDVEYEDKLYALLLPVSEDIRKMLKMEDADYLPFEVSTDDDGNEVFEIVSEDSLYRNVLIKYWTEHDD